MSGLPNNQDNNDEILAAIENLQQMEQELINSLETNPNLTEEEQQEIITKIQQISSMRENLYQTLSGLNGFFQGALESSTGTLQQQTAAIAIVEDELNQAKGRLQILEDEKINKLRLVEINDYYKDKYAEHAMLMKIVIFMLVPILILTILYRKGLLPNPIYYGIIVIISVIGGYFFWARLASIIMRDNMNYQEYNWYFDANSAPTGSSSSDDPWVTTSLTMPGTCIGSACCSSNQTYDVSSNLCVDSTTTTTTESFTNNTNVLTEAMINSVLTKTSGKLKPDYTMNAESRIKPRNAESFINFKM
jgi:hypothetical protein